MPFTLAKERELYRYLPRNHSAYQFAPFDDASQNTFVPQSSKDHALTVFAQIGAMRLGAQRAMISFFGPTHQYILAEATGMVGPDDHDSLWLGCCVLPKGKGLCENVAALPLKELSEDPTIVGGSALVMLDLQGDERFKHSGLADSLSEARFYAGVPIISPKGITIGSYCVLDKEPRNMGLDKPSLTFMKDMAATVMDHLDMVRSKHQDSLAERMIWGLGRFLEGKATFHDPWYVANEQDAVTGRSKKIVERQLNKKEQDIQEEKQCPDHRRLPYLGAVRDSSQSRSSSNTCVKGSSSDVASSGLSTRSSAAATNSTGPELNQNQPKKADMNQQNVTSFKSSVSGDTMPDEGFPIALRKTFSRAANLIRESIEVEGVAFLDATIESFGGISGDYNRKSREAYARDATLSSDDSTKPRSMPNTADTPISEPEIDNTTTCRTLASATSASSIDDDSKPNHDFAVRESFLKAILNRHPHGKIFNYNESGSAFGDSGRGGISQSLESYSDSEKKENQRESNLDQDANDLIKVFTGARSIIFLLMWDSRKSKWFSSVFVWTNTPKRVFASENELVYLHAFGNTVMAEVHRLDSEIAERAKTNLVSSITHELRSPLHGALGTADILSDTAMNALQHGMVHTIESCGRTLLDTINHLLEFNYIDKFKKDGALKKKHAQNGKQFSVPGHVRENFKQDPPTSDDSAYAPVQLDVVLEEVVECVFAGHSFYDHPRVRPRNVKNSGWSKSAVAPTKPVTIIFDIQQSAEWTFITHAGAWRRILMNVFSNALKYTPSGFIYLGLKANPIAQEGTDDGTERKGPEDQNSQVLVALTVKDTGRGIDEEYLKESLFTPFSQEDILAPGSGLGLSIVHQAITSLGGSINASSDKNKGTEISIEVPLGHIPLPDQSDDSSSDEVFNSIKNLTQGKAIGLAGFCSPVESERDTTLYNSLERLCQDWFHLEVKPVSLKEDVACDFYLTVQTELDNPDIEGNSLLNFDRPIDEKVKGISPLLVICQSPEVAHNMSAAATSQGETSAIQFISQPCGPQKLAKALDLCINRRQDQGQGPGEPTRWVELPESSHLPLDIGPTDPPDERMKISKRPTAETMANQELGSREYAPRDQIPNSTSSSGYSSPSGNIVEKGPESSGPSVLLVEDNELNLKLLVSYVKKEGWSCYMTATNGLEAIEAYKAHPGKFKAVIIDISMPVMDGFEAAQSIRHLEREYWGRNGSSIPPRHPTTIVALTGLDSADAQQEAFASGINIFLTKPVKRQDLRPILQSVIERLDET